MAGALQLAGPQRLSNLVAVQLVGGRVQVKVSAGSARILMDVAGYYSAATPVMTPPGPVTTVTATATTTSIALVWTNPTEASLTAVMIRRALGATAPANATAGTLVIDAAKPAASYTDAGLASGTQYSYALFAHDGTPVYAAAATVTSTTTAIRPGVTVLARPLRSSVTRGTSAGLNFRRCSRGLRMSALRATIDAAFPFSPAWRTAGLAPAQ